MKVTATLGGLKVADKNFKNPRIDGDKLILSDGGTINFDGEENSGPNDCYNYVDWSALEDTGFFNEEITIDNLKIESCCTYGFKINGYFVPCYSAQNGWYTNVLNLLICDKEGKKVSEFDISCEEIY